MRTSFRVFFALLDELEARPNNRARRLPRIPDLTRPARPCPDGAIRATLDDITDERVRLAIRVGAEAGLRRMEIAGLRRDAVEGWAGCYRLRIRGKGGHERMVPIADDLAALLLAVETAHIFSAIDGHITPRHLGELTARGIARPVDDPHLEASLRHRRLLCFERRYPCGAGIARPSVPGDDVDLHEDL